jgi:hypothetical protein
MWKLILEKCRSLSSLLNQKREMYLRKIIMYNLIRLPPARVIPDNLGRNSFVDKNYAGKEVTAGRNSDTPPNRINLGSISIGF